MTSARTKTVVLINPSFQHQKHRNVKEARRRATARHHPPLNLLHIGGALRSAGFGVRIIDCHIEENPFSALDRALEEENVLWIGVTVKMAPPLQFAQQICYYAKRRRPDVPVVWGGLLPTILPETVLREAYVDYCVLGRGESVAVELSLALASGREPGEIRGVARLGPGGELVATPPDPAAEEGAADYSLIGDKLCFEQVPYVASMTTAQGCLLGCSFCYLTSLGSSLDHLRVWRERPLPLVLGEVDSLRGYGINVLTPQDDCFLMGRDRILPLLAAFKERKLYIEQCVTAIGTLTPEVVLAVAPMIQQVGFSIETVNPDLQKILNKPIPAAKVIEKARLLYDHGVNSTHNFVFSIPGETDDDLRANIDLAVQLRGINPFIRFTGIHCIPYPRSRMEEWLREERGMRVPWDLRMLATTDMNDLKLNPAYQPWITDAEDAAFYDDFMIAFDAVFSRWQRDRDARVEAILAKPRIHRLFEEALALPPPPPRLPYILDRLIKNPGIPYPAAKQDINRLPGDPAP